MKKTALIACAAALLTSASAEAQWLTNTSKLYQNPFYNVAVGISGHENIYDRFTVHGTMGFLKDDANNPLRYFFGRSANGLVLFSNEGWSGGSGMFMHGYNAGSGGNIDFVSRLNASPSSNLSLFSFIAYDVSRPGQEWRNFMMLDQTGNLRIGENIPAYNQKLTVETSLGFHNPTNNTYSTIYGRSKDRGLALFGNVNNDKYDPVNPGTNNGGASILINGNNLSNPAKGGIQYIASASSTTDIAHSFIAISGTGGWDPLMTMRKDGIVTVGNVPIPNSNYKLIVEKGILTERVRVAVQNTADWSDYVFADNYELKPLNEVEEFIKENKHLPEIPSAQDVVNEGIDMAKMDAKLLQKIEELTLYVINLQKQIQQQQKRIDVQSEELRNVKHSK